MNFETVISQDEIEAFAGVLINTAYAYGFDKPGQAYAMLALSVRFIRQEMGVSAEEIKDISEEELQ